MRFTTMSGIRASEISDRSGHAGVLGALGFESLARESRDTTQPSNSVIAGSPQRLWLCFHGDSKPRTRDAAESVVAAGDDLMHREVGQLAGGRPIIGIRVLAGHLGRCPE
jgi:hypothetical protein